MGQDLQNHHCHLFKALHEIQEQNQRWGRHNDEELSKPVPNGKFQKIKEGFSPPPPLILSLDGLEVGFRYGGMGLLSERFSATGDLRRRLTPPPPPPLF